MAFRRPVVVVDVRADTHTRRRALYARGAVCRTTVKKSTNARPFAFTGNRLTVFYMIFYRIKIILKTVLPVDVPADLFPPTPRNRIVERAHCRPLNTGGSPGTRIFFGCLAPVSRSNRLRTSVSMVINRTVVEKCSRKKPTPTVYLHGIFFVKNICKKFRAIFEAHISMLY